MILLIPVPVSLIHFKSIFPNPAFQTVEMLQGKVLGLRLGSAAAAASRTAGTECVFRLSYRLNEMYESRPLACERKKETTQAVFPRSFTYLYMYSGGGAHEISLGVACRGNGNQ